MTNPPGDPPFDDDEPQQPGLPLDPAGESSEEDGPVDDARPEAGAAEPDEGVFEPPWESTPDPTPPDAERERPPGPAAGETALPVPPPPISRAAPPPREPSAPSEGAPVARPHVARAGAGADRERPFAPVIFDDDERGEPPAPFAEYDDSGVLRVLGVIVLLAIVIAVLVLPPISILDRGGDEGSGGLSVQARDELPVLPNGLVAASQLYDLEPDDSLEGQNLWTLSIKLSEATEDDRNLAFYTHQDGEWLRLTSAVLVNDGTEAEAEVSAIPSNIAVLRRTAFERTLGLIVESGETPDPDALASNPIVAVMAGSLGIGDDGTAALSSLPDSVDAAALGGTTVYLGVRAEPEAQPALDQLLGTEPATVAHVGELVAAVQATSADGLYLAYLDVDRTRQAGLTRLVTQLASELNEAGLGLVVGVPAPATSDTGAYDWAALSEVAGALWLNAPEDPSAYYEQLETVLDAQQAAGVELDQVSLVIGRMSHIRDGNGVQAIDRHEALGRAAQLEAGAEGGIAVGDLVSLTAVNMAQELGNSGLRWDSPSRTVSFAFAERGGPRTVWVENGYSMAFRLDLAQRYDLGGVVIADAQADETLPAIWEPLAGYLDSGAVTLLQPYGPYLNPCWQALDGVIEGEAGNCWASGTVSGVATWRAPGTPGVYEVRLVVSDGEAFVGRQLALRVTEEGEQPDPTPEPTETPTAEPTSEATQAAGPAPTEEPTVVATEEPTVQPTVEPTQVVTPVPTTEPTAAPTVSGTAPAGPPGPGGNE